MGQNFSVLCPIPPHLCGGKGGGKANTVFSLQQGSHASLKVSLEDIYSLVISSLSHLLVITQLQLYNLICIFYRQPFTKQWSMRATKHEQWNMGKCITWLNARKTIILLWFILWCDANAASIKPGVTLFTPYPIFWLIWVTKQSSTVVLVFFWLCGRYSMLCLPLVSSGFCCRSCTTLPIGVHWFQMIEPHTYFTCRKEFTSLCPLTWFLMHFSDLVCA